MSGSLKPELSHLKSVQATYREPKGQFLFILVLSRELCGGVRIKLVEWGVGDEVVSETIGWIPMSNLPYSIVIEFLLSTWPAFPGAPVASSEPMTIVANGI